jgi:outer membrane receptor protein involved in Fe transport
LDWRVGSRWDFNGGLRLNETYERKQSSHIDGFDPEANTFDDRKRAVTRLSGMAGLTFRAWTERTDELAVYANYRDTFKPAAVDFGPDNTPDILAPETARSYELGLKGRILGGRLDYQLGVFRLDFSNLVIAVADAAGDPMLENAGGERLQGVEAEGRWRMSSRLAVTGAGSWHDARFTHYVGAEGDVSGHRLTLAPHWLGSLGVTYAPTSGFFGSVNFAYVGERYLDLANSALAGAYVTVDASVGWRWRRYGLSINGTNLSDERPPVTASEFGDQSFYRLVGRRVFVEISAAL